MIGYRVKRQTGFDEDLDYKDPIIEYAQGGTWKYSIDPRKAKIWPSAKLVRGHLAMFNDKERSRMTVEQLELNVVNELSVEEFTEYNEPK